MAIEIEAKMAVEDFAPIRVRLLERGGRLLGRYHEINTFFDTSDGALVKADKGLRLRVKRNLDTQEEQYITFGHGRIYLVNARNVREDQSAEGVVRLRRLPAGFYEIQTFGAPAARVGLSSGETARWNSITSRFRL